jgi:histidyl-tRNA synthetase
VRHEGVELVSEGAQKKLEKARKFQAIRGTRDLLPPETELWNHVDQTARDVFGSFGYGEIRPPIFEATELFARSIGEETDVVSKEMYTMVELGAFEEDDLSNLQKTLAVLELTKEGIARWDTASSEYLSRIQAMTTQASLTLRPEATASVCRAYIEHNMQQWPQPVKLYYIGPMFRRERPQKGRYRQFYQIGAEVLEVVRPEAAKSAPAESAKGSADDSSLAPRPSPLATSSKELKKDAAVDAEVIEMLMTFFERIDLQGTELSVNSIGHAADNCRRGYVAKLRDELGKVKDQLGADSQRRIETNPLRVLDSKLEHEQPIIAKLPHIADHLCDDCKTHYAELKRQLDLRGVKYKENWRLVRGLDYYMRTTFEITARGLGSQDAVCGGGRYDGLVELLGGQPTKGIGFAIGEDRVILSLQEQKSEQAASLRTGIDVYVTWMGENAYPTALRAAKMLRGGGFRVDMPASELKFGKALERASKLNARFALILGENEVQSGEWTLKNLADGSQQKLTEAALLEYLRR